MRGGDGEELGRVGRTMFGLVDANGCCRLRRVCVWRRFCGRTVSPMSLQGQRYFTVGAYTDQTYGLASNQFTGGGRPETERRRGVDAMLCDADGLVDGVEVACVEVDPAGRVRLLVVVNVDGHAAGQVVGAVVAAAGLTERL